MKKTRKKKQVCGTACFMAAEIKLSKDVCLSVCLLITPFLLCSHHLIIIKFSEVITNDQSKVHAKGQGQRSKVKATEVTTQLNRFRTVIPVGIHIWWWNDAYSLMFLRRRALLFFKVIQQISRSHGSKIVEFDPDRAFPDCNSSLNSPMAKKWCTKLEVALKRCPIAFQGDPNLLFLGTNSSLNTPMATKWCTMIEVALKRCPIVFQGHPPNFKVTQLKKNCRIWPNWAFLDRNSSLNSPMATKLSIKLEVA